MVHDTHTRRRLSHSHLHVVVTSYNYKLQLTRSCVMYHVPYTVCSLCVSYLTLLVCHDEEYLILLGFVYFVYKSS